MLKFLRRLFPNNEARALLIEVHDYLESDRVDRHDDNAPGHCHGSPGIWDATGEPCEWCATWRRVREYVKRSR